MDKKADKKRTKPEEPEKPGINAPEDRYWGNIRPRISGTVSRAVGGGFTKNAVENVEKDIVNKSK